MIEALGVCLQRGGRALVDNVSMRARPGALTALTGPNGAGKSSLLGVLAGTTLPDAGAVHLAGKALSAHGARGLAMQRAVVTQRPSVAFAFTAGEVVALGRTAYGDGDTPAGRRRVHESLARVGLGAMAARVVATLSGGEQQRVHVARALCQMDGCPTPCLLLDEPTAHLDLAEQHRLLRLLRALADAGATVVAVLHELPLVLRYTDDVVLMAHGAVVAAGPTALTLTDAAMTAAYDTPLRRLGVPGQPGCTVEPVDAAGPRGDHP